MSKNKKPRVIQAKKSNAMIYIKKNKSFKIAMFMRKIKLFLIK